MTAPPVIEVLDAQRSLYAAELALAEPRGNEYHRVVQLHKALGGGWQQHQRDKKLYHWCIDSGFADSKRQWLQANGPREA